MQRKFTSFCVLLLLCLCSVNGWGQTSYTSTAATGAWNTARWNNSADAAPYTSTYTANNDVNFTSGTYAIGGMGASTNVGNVTLGNNVTVTFTAGSTFATGGNVRTINVGDGAFLNMVGQSISTAAGVGFNKTGNGTWSLQGSAYTGGFTLTAGTMAIGGVNAMGNGTLALNGGTVTASTTTARDLTGKYSFITIGGDIQFGEVSTVNANAGNGNLTFSNSMSLGSALRTLTLGNAATITFGGIISNTTATGLTFRANGNGTGKFVLTGANTYSGPTAINGGTVQLNHTGGGTLTLPATSNVTVNGGTLQISTNQTLNNLTLASGTTLTIDNGVVLTVNGTFRQNGTINGSGTVAYGSNGTLIYGGTSAQTTGIELATSIPNLIINNGNGVSLSSATRVTGALTLESGILTTNSKLTLASTSTGTAYLAPVGAFGNNGNITGNVTVERYIPAHAARAYTMAGFSTFGGTIYNNWQEGGAATVGYGTQISGSSAGNGFDFASAAGIASIYTYDDPDFPTGSKWQGLFNTNNTTPTPAINGYLLFVRGDRTVGAGSGAPLATTLRTTGSLATGHIGPMSMFVGAYVYSLVANPYACAINWSTTTKTNILGSFTVYDPNYLTFVTSNGTTVSPNISQQQADVIQSGQAFFTQNDGSGNTPGWEVDETDKNIGAATGTSSTVFGMQAPTAQLNINFFKAGNVFADGAVAVFGTNYKAKEDAKDAAKFTNFSETVSFAENNNRFLSIDARPLPQINDTLFIDLKQMSANAAYTIIIDGKGFTSDNLQSATLVDKVTGNSTSLDLSTTTSYSFTTSAAAEAGRLYIVLSGKPVVTVPAPPVDSSYSSALQVTLLGNPVKDNILLHYIAQQSGNTTVRLIDANGQAMTSMSLGVQQQGTVTIPVAEYAGGLYLVEVTVGSNKVLTKVVKQ